MVNTEEKHLNLSKFNNLIDDLEQMIKDQKFDVRKLTKQIKVIKKQVKSTEITKNELFPLSNDFIHPFNSLLSIGSCDIVHDKSTNSHDVFFSTNGSLFYCFKKLELWNINRVTSSHGDISAIFEHNRNHSAVFFVNVEGYLSYCYFDKKWKFDVFKNIGMISGRISSVFETNRFHSAVFCLTTDSLYYIYKENEIWKTESSIFKNYPCKGDISAVFHRKYSKSSVFYEGKDGYIHYWIMTNSNPIHKILLYSRPSGGIIKSIYNNSTSQFVLVYSDGDTGELFYSDIKSENNVKKICKKSKGDVDLCINMVSKNVEILFSSDDGISLFELNQDGAKEIDHIDTRCGSPISMSVFRNVKGEIERKIVFYSKEANGIIDYFNSKNELKREFIIKKSLFEQDDFIFFHGEFPKN